MIQPKGKKEQIGQLFSEQICFMFFLTIFKPRAKLIKPFSNKSSLLLFVSNLLQREIYCARLTRSILQIFFLTFSLRLG